MRQRASKHFRGYKPLVGLAWKLNKQSILYCFARKKDLPYITAHIDCNCRASGPDRDGQCQTVRHSSPKISLETHSTFIRTPDPFRRPHQKRPLHKEACREGEKNSGRSLTTYPNFLSTNTVTASSWAHIHSQFLRAHFRIPTTLVLNTPRLLHHLPFQTEALSNVRVFSRSENLGCRTAIRLAP